MKSKNFKLIFFLISLTNISFLQAHDSINGGCKNHCKESLEPITIEKKINNINDKNKIEDNYSCLMKSLCRG